MRRLLDRLDQVGAFGINLLEFCYPMGAWDEFERRGFSVKNPPFPVLYDYGYAGGLPLAGSESLCLELLEYALDEGCPVGLRLLARSRTKLAIRSAFKTALAPSMRACTSAIRMILPENGESIRWRRLPGAARAGGVRHRRVLA